MEGATGKAHRFAKVRDSQQHKLARSDDGELSLGITHRLEEQARKWTQVCEATGQRNNEEREEYDIQWESVPELTVEQLRTAAGCFKVSTT